MTHLNNKNNSNDRRWTMSALVVASLMTAMQTALAQPNILFIMTDQQRYDCIRRTQDDLPEYRRKLKIRTPNLDRLSREGVYFRNAYTQCAVCGPARTVLRTGNTIERTGVQTNALADAEVLYMEPLFNQKIQSIDSLDQILTEDYGYTSEYYGKWHIPERLYYTRDGTANAIRYNDFDYAEETPRFSLGAWQSKLLRYLNHAELTDMAFTNTYQPGDQEDTYSLRAYEPIWLDSRHGFPTDTKLTPDTFDYWARIQPAVKGRYRLDETQTATFYNADTVIRAIDRVVGAGELPFSITASLHHPHPPMMATPRYLDYYWENRDQLMVPPNHLDPMENSGYVFSGEQTYLDSAGYMNATAVQEWTALYYAMIEEIDDWVGVMLDKLEEHGLTDNTIVLFTSDHGEMLGSHRGREKGKFFEEASKVPFFIKYPPEIPAGTVVEERVSHLDVVATLLDYAGASASDNSDGTSLRRFIESVSWNENYDEDTVVGEWDYRHPTSETELERPLDSQPSFCVWHKEWKLMMHKQASSSKIDMMYNLKEDRFEMNNPIGLYGQLETVATDEIIGKAEHLRILLLEWMERMDGDDGYFSDPKHNAGEGMGDIAEITERREWRQLDIWHSEHDMLEFGPSMPVLSGGMYRRNEYFYVGRQTPGVTNINSITITGPSAGLFSYSLLTSTGATPAGPVVAIGEQGYLRIRIAYANAAFLSQEALASTISATLNIGHDAPGFASPISVDLSFMGRRATMEPTTTPYPTESPTTEAPTVTPMPTPEPPISFVTPVVACGLGLDGLCGRCMGHCRSDADCEDGLVCFLKDMGGVPVPGCLGGPDLSLTQWCILPTPPPTTAPEPSAAPVSPPPTWPAEDSLPRLDVRECTVDSPCVRCEGHCESDAECGDGLICSTKNGRGLPVPGCLGIDMSFTEWCIMDPNSLTDPPTKEPTVPPTLAPTKEPTVSPTEGPTMPPSMPPTTTPTSILPTMAPTPTATLGTTGGDLSTFGAPSAGAGVSFMLITVFLVISGVLLQ